MTKDELISECCKIIECDSARISQPCGTMFLIIGFKRNTKDDLGQWMKNDKPYDFEYTDEKVIASGMTDEELIASVKEYKRLCNITWTQYFKELAK